MIAPFTGNGMSMAFESAEIAISPLAAYARQEIQWGDAQRAIAEECVSDSPPPSVVVLVPEWIISVAARMPLLPIAIHAVDLAIAVLRHSVDCAPSSLLRFQLFTHQTVG